MKFKFGKILLILIIVLGIFGFVKFSYALGNCSPYTEQACNADQNCLWSGGYCQDTSTLSHIDCKALPSQFMCDANSASGCRWSVLNGCENASGISAPSTEIGTIGQNAPLPTTPKKVLVIGGQMFYDGCVKSYGFVNTLNKTLNPDYTFECKIIPDQYMKLPSVYKEDKNGNGYYDYTQAQKDAKQDPTYASVFNYTYAYPGEDFTLDDFGALNFLNTLKRYKNSGYDEVLLLMNFENLSTDSGGRSGSASDDLQYLNDFLDIANTNNIRIVSLNAQPFKGLIVQYSAAVSDPEWSQEWQERVDARNDLMKSSLPLHDGVSINLQDVIGSRADKQKLNPVYDVGDHYDLNRDGQQVLGQYLIDNVYQKKETSSTTTSTLQFCTCLSDKSSCEVTKYDNKRDCERSLGSSSNQLECVKVDKDKECSSLVDASQNNNGQINSDLLSGLSGDIKNLNKLNSENLQQLIGNFIKGLLMILGTFALMVIIYGGFLFMTANGSADKKKKAIGIFVWSVLGLVIIFSSYAIVNFVLDLFR